MQGTAASTKNKLPALITSMETIGAKALEEFADSIKVRHTFWVPTSEGTSIFKSINDLYRNVQYEYLMMILI